MKFHLMSCLSILSSSSLSLLANPITSSSLPTGYSQEEMQTDQKQISEYLGYLLWKELNRSLHFPYKIEDVIQGIQKAEKGDVQTLTKIEYQQALMRVEETLYHQKLQNNLRESENFIKEFAKQNEVLEVVKGKLYVQIIHEGDGKEIESCDKGTFHLKCETAKGTTIINTFEEDLPQLQDLTVAIPGFTLGVMGMKENEIRLLYIHPDLAYGFSHDMEPNSLLIVEVKLLHVQPSMDQS